MKILSILLAGCGLLGGMVANASADTPVKQVSNEVAPLPTDAELSPDIQAALKQLPALNVFRMVTIVPQAFKPFISMAKALLTEGKFDSKLRETAILRVAYLTHASYEWHQHAFIAQTVGVTDKEMNIIRTQNPVRGLSEEGNFVCQVADELTKNATLSDKTFKELYERYDREKATELVFDISFFNMLSRMLNATRVQIEPTNPLQGHASPFGVKK